MYSTKSENNESRPCGQLPNGWRLIKKVGKNVTKDYIFLKLLYHYNTRVVSGSDQEQEYIKLFAALEAKDKFIPFVEQKRIEQKAKTKR